MHCCSFQHLVIPFIMKVFKYDFNFIISKILYLINILNGVESLLRRQS
jgi:hypothetical protein